ncbi:FUSC family protein [Apilactobacillus xinyiensis]|uniref:FUSC family protein n=1 Tax=Apilactobacillus xinyiensis TaxID=2841032 RepID=UPI001C7CF272|nr:FUSC family protein [Apilactobacillus xinyiensis]
MENKIILGNISLKVSNLLSLTISMIIMQLVNDIHLGTLIVLGSLFFYYYIPQENHQGFKNVLIAGIAGMIAFLIMNISNVFPWVTALILGTICCFFFFYNKYWNLTGPGPFFLVMISCISGVHKYINAYTTTESIFYLSIGVIISIVLAAINEFIFDHFQIMKKPSNSNKIRFKVDKVSSDIIIKSFVYGFAVFLSYYIGQNLGILNYYWVVIACSSILQAKSMSHAFKRHQNYVLGTIVGCVISYAILSINFSPIIISILLIIFNSLIYWKINTNFLVGNFFTTPMAILISKLSNPMLNNEAIPERFAAILIGTTIGIVSVYVLNYLQKKCI